jgi:hypothetical protein
LCRRKQVRLTRNVHLREMKLTLRVLRKRRSLALKAVIGVQQLSEEERMRNRFRQWRTSPLALLPILPTLLLRAAPIVAVVPATSCYTRTGTTSDFCYTFRVVHETCRVGRAVNWGCQDNREYRWTTGCVGWFEAYHAGPIGRCFKERLKDEGACSETKSLPPPGERPHARLINATRGELVSAIPLSAYGSHLDPAMDPTVVANLVERRHSAYIDEQFPLPGKTDRMKALTAVVSSTR